MNNTNPVNKLKLMLLLSLINKLNQRETEQEELIAIEESNNVIEETQSEKETTSTNDYYDNNDNHNEEKSNQVEINRNLCESVLIRENLCYEDHAIASLDDISKIYDIESFEYDKTGNRTKLVQNGDIYYYSYGTNNKLLKVELQKKDTLTKKVFAEYVYDKNGNTTKRTITKTDGTKSIIVFTYDTMNRLLTTIENGTKKTEYRYDNAGNRFIKKTDKELTVYLRHGQIAVAMDIEVKFDSTSDYGSINRYVLSGDLLAGKITKTIKLDNSVVIKKEWYHLDHLNSTKATTDEAGKMSTMYEYRAFGEELKKLGSGDAKYKFQGKELDEETNLMYFNARYYDQTIGRFINVDPIQSGENWYVAFGNNPLNKVDPTGLQDYGLFFDPIRSILDGMRQTGKVITDEINKILNSNQKYAVSGKANLGLQGGDVSANERQFMNISGKIEKTSEGINIKTQPGISIVTPLVNISLKENLYLMKNNELGFKKGDSEFGVDLNVLSVGKTRFQLQGRVNLNSGDISVGQSVSQTMGNFSISGEVQHNISKTIKDLSGLCNTLTKDTRIMPELKNQEKK